MTTHSSTPGQPHSSGWVTFTYASFAISAGMTALGILFLPLDLWSKGYMAMCALMLVQSCITLSKTIRDNHESTRFVNRLEDARTERLLMEVGKTS